MRPAFTVIRAMHHSIAALLISTCHGFREADKAFARNDLALHPDDFPEVDAVMEADANALRSLAYEIDIRRIELKRNVLQYRLEAAE
jgi:hypothetical protein